MQIHRGDLLTACHNPDKFGNHKDCDSKDIVLLICYVISRDHMF